MKIFEVLQEASVSRRGFLQGLLSTAASSGVNVSGLAKAVSALSPNVLASVDKIAAWVGEDQKKLDLLGDWVQGFRDALSRNDKDEIYKQFKLYYRNKNPKSLNTQVNAAYDNYMDRLRREFLGDPNGHLDALRDLKGSALDIDGVLNIFKDYGDNANAEIDTFKTALETDRNVFKVFFDIQQLIEKNRSLAAFARAAAARMAPPKVAPAAQSPAKPAHSKSLGDKLRDQIEKAKKQLLNPNADQEKTKFAITQQLSAVQQKLSGIENADPEIVQQINDKCNWVKGKLDTINNPDVAKAVIKQLEHINTLLAEITPVQQIQQDSTENSATPG